MKRLKKLALSILGVTVLSLGLYACSNDGDVENDSISNVQKRENNLNDIINELKNDEDFIILTNNLIKFTEAPKNTKLKNQLLSKEVLDESEKELLAKSLGFLNINEAYNFEIKNIQSISNFTKKFNLTRFNPTELTIIYEGAFNYVTTGRTCKEKLGTCNQGSWAIYGIEMTGCISAGIGIGALTFWSAGIIGGVVGSACATAATIHCDAMLTACSDSYNDCIGN